MSGIVTDWTEDTPTRIDHGNAYGQHGRTDAGAPVVRMVYADGSPLNGAAGEWHACEECGPDGAFIVEVDE